MLEYKHTPAGLDQVQLNYPKVLLKPLNLPDHPGATLVVAAAPDKNIQMLSRGTILTI